MTNPSTIPTTLRETARWTEEMPAFEGADPALLRDAADEIERLRGVLNGLAEEFERAVGRATYTAEAQRLDNCAKFVRAFIVAPTHS